MSDFDLQRILAGVVAKFGVKKLGELDFAKLAEVLPENLEVEQVEEVLDALFDLSNIDDQIYELPIKENEAHSSQYDEVTNSLAGYILQLKNIVPLENFEEQDLIDMAEQGNRDARNRLIEAYLPMVLNIAREKGHKRDEILEFIQEGNIALIQAVESYSMDGNSGLRDYSRWRVRKAIVKSQRQQEQLIKLPKAITLFFQKFKETCDELHRRSNRAPELEEIATRMNMDIELVRKNLTLGSTLMAEGDNVTSEDAAFMRYLKDFKTLDDFAIQKFHLLRNNIKKNLDLLSPVEQEILRLFYDLDEKGSRLDVFEIADELGLKTKHVEDLKTAAITKVHQGSVEV
tara:strand:- start:5058 stop:6092 length:1035 start_codon:yes stop_codon:yes gene_type:complete